MMVYGGDMPPPARGCPRRGRGAPEYIIILSELSDNFNDKVVLLTLLCEDVLAVDE